MQYVPRDRAHQEQMKHEIPEDTLNSRIETCIEEYVRLRRDRDILREHWFGGKSFKELSDIHKMSMEGVKKVIYGIGDKILLRASKP